MTAVAAILDWGSGRAPLGGVARLLAITRHRATAAPRTLRIDHRDARLELGVVPSASALRAGDARLSHHVASGVAVAADASLYNRKVLARELGLETSDTAALLIGAWQRWGLDFIDRLDGDFALLLFDTRRELLLAAVDPFGVRQLVHARVGHRTIIASETKQILASGLVACEPDVTRLAEHMVDTHNDPARTFFKDVRKIAPGHLLIAGRERIETKRYYLPPLSCVAPRREDAAEAFGQRLAQSVTKRLASPEPALIELSGGHDSSSIAAIAATRQDRIAPIMATSYTYAGLESDERAYIEDLLARYPLPWLEVPSHPDVEANRLQEAMWRADCPFADPQARMRVAIERAAQAMGAGVIVSGLGGDEVLYDRSVTSDLKASGHLRLLVSEAATWREVAGLLAPAWLRAAVHQARGRSAETAPMILRPEVRAALSRPAPLPAGLTGLQGLLWRWLALDGRISWTAGLYGLGSEGPALEVRFPFLDRALFELLFTLPLHARPRQGTSKRLLRTAMAGLLPPSINDRTEKTSFAAFYTTILKRLWPEVRPRIAHHLKDPGGLLQGLVDVRAVEAQIAAFEAAPEPSWPQSHPMWRMTWMALWIDQLHRYNGAERDVALMGAQ